MIRPSVSTIVSCRPFRGQIGQFAENDGKDHHGQERPDHSPRSSNHRLLVADGHVPPGQHAKQLAILPKITPIMAFGATGFDDGFLHQTTRKRSRTSARSIFQSVIDEFEDLILELDDPELVSSTNSRACTAAGQMHEISIRMG